MWPRQPLEIQFWLHNIKTWLAPFSLIAFLELAVQGIAAPAGGCVRSQRASPFTTLKRDVKKENRRGNMFLLQTCSSASRMLFEELVEQTLACIAS